MNSFRLLHAFVRVFFYVFLHANYAISQRLRPSFTAIPGESPTRLTTPPFTERNIFGSARNSSSVQRDVLPLPQDLVRGGSRQTNIFANRTVSSENVGIRLRLNEPFFSETARLFYNVFTYQIQTISIAPQQQCFPEGCFSLYNFRITGFQRPRAISLRPLAPNLLLLSVFAFDVDITGLIYGNLQLLISVPVRGSIAASARQLSVTATFSLQKNQNRVPYLHMSSCELGSGYVNTQVSDMGLLTDAINVKYRNEMIAKARQIISSTICGKIEKTLQAQINERFRQMPRSLSVHDILQYFTNEARDRAEPKTALLMAGNPKDETKEAPVPIPKRKLFDYSHSEGLPFALRRRKKRAGSGAKNGAASTSAVGVARIEEITDQRRKPVLVHPVIMAANTQNSTVDVRESSTNATDDLSNTPFGNITERTSSGNNSLFPGGIGTPAEGQSSRPSSSLSSGGIKSLLSFIDASTLNRIFINMDFLDSTAGSDYFSVGMDGTVFLKSPQPVIFAEPPSSDLVRKLQFPGHVRRQSMEALISDFTPNSLLIQAHRANLLKVEVGCDTPLFGSMLRTYCTADEVCLSDSIPEVAEKYPNQQLSLQLETVRPPKLTITEDNIRLTIVGQATFLLSSTRQKIGRIPFTSTAQIAVRTSDKRIYMTLTIPELTILDDLEFFELPAETLGGFRDAVKGMVENMAKQYLQDGIDTRQITKKLATYGITNVAVVLLAEGLMLLQADVDAYKLVFDYGQDF